MEYKLTVPNKIWVLYRVLYYMATVYYNTTFLLKTFILYYVEIFFLYSNSYKNHRNTGIKREPSFVSCTA